ncbi:MAG: L-threonylcarbamoyladenylate synthase [Bacteroidota bacterium]
MKTDSGIIGQSLDRAKEALESGKLVAIPTETVYGLAANALNPNAVARIFEAKKRPTFDPLIVHIPDASHLDRYTQDIPEKARALADALWPGPLTMVLPKKPIIPDLVTSGLPTVAVRSPRHPLSQKLLRQLDFPLSAPSANPFGYLSPTQPEHVADQLGSEVAYILDGGPCEVGLESTIVSFENPGKIEMLRAGGYPREEIEDLLNTHLAVRTHSTSNPSAPGMLAQHYSPHTPLMVVPIGSDTGQNPLSLDSERSLHPEQTKIAYISLMPLKEKPAWATDHFAWTESGNLRQAATRLFALLRTLDRSNYDLIVAEQVPNQGLGPAINDRLARAAARS